MNPKTILGIGGVVLAMLIVVVLIFVFGSKSSTTPNLGTGYPTQTPSPSGFPIVTPNPTGTQASTSSGTISVPTSAGTKIAVKDFRATPNIAHDASNPDYYYLSGGTNVAISNAPYQTFYIASDGSFGITLFQEPLGEYRRKAEQELQARLGLTNDQMCSLNYYLTAGPGVSEKYSNINLGFSFCPGAVPLP